MRALYIGRFQPFHKGHAEVTRLISREYKDFIIGIGQSRNVIFTSLPKEKSDEFAFMLKMNEPYDSFFFHTPENPFTAQERSLMIKAFFKTENINNYRICDIPDINLFSARDIESTVMPFYKNKLDTKNENGISVEIISSGDIDFPRGGKKILYLPLEKTKEWINKGISKRGWKTSVNIFTSAIINEEDNFIVSSLPRDILLNWVEHVISIVPKFDVVFSNNPLTEELFSKKGYTVKKTPLFSRHQYSGTEIRRRIAHNEPWEKLVPDDVVKIIGKIDGVQRIKNLFL